MLHIVQYKQFESTSICNKSQTICDVNVICENVSHGAKYQIWVIGIISKFVLYSFQNFLLGPSVMLVPKVTDVQKVVKNKEKH